MTRSQSFKMLSIDDDLKSNRTSPRKRPSSGEDEGSGREKTREFWPSSTKTGERFHPSLMLFHNKRVQIYIKTKLETQLAEPEQIDISRMQNLSLYSNKWGYVIADIHKYKHLVHHQTRFNSKPNFRFNSAQKGGGSWAGRCPHCICEPNIQ